MPPGLLFFSSAGIISLKLRLSGSTGTDHGITSAEFNDSGNESKRLGIKGTEPFEIPDTPEGVGSVGAGGNSGDSGKGKSIIDEVATGKSLRLCLGKAGASGASGDGISGNPSWPVKGWSGAFTGGGVVDTAASTGTGTGETAGCETTGTSVSVKVICLLLAAPFLLVLPLVIVPGITGGGTFQSDWLLRVWATVRFTQTVIAAKSKIGINLLRPLILSG
ncbi:hypothetical protein HYN43_013235 [Mucilaginibacter celer]|uniref:Uncharacterized protein n=1 Tax=Mucilaginibacter celer TaxID=2305508 RepID=A0A494VLP4_9SPHI|nr:hypothetical protein HYN43_013235 [Mucilaginibacter celer]